jgi:phospholipase A1
MLVMKKILKTLILTTIILSNFAYCTEEIKFFEDKFDDTSYKFNLLSHNENYIFLFGKSSNGLIQKHYKNGIYDKSSDFTRKNNEVQFQISFKTFLYKNFLNSGGNLFVAYTQNSYWQLYDRKHSSPFRETNYAPELFLEWNMNKKFANSALKKVRFSLIHQSNGQDVGKSRSWNRGEIHLLFQNDNLKYGVNFWQRWNEKSKTNLSLTDGDDNPSLTDKIGKQKLFIQYKYKKTSIALIHQNNIFHYDANQGNTKLDIKFPSGNNNFDFFVRYFTGYGESLIDYDIKIKRLSFGIIISDWI